MEVDNRPTVTLTTGDNMVTAAPGSSDVMVTAGPSNSDVMVTAGPGNSDVMVTAGPGNTEEEGSDGEFSSDWSVCEELDENSIEYLLVAKRNQGESSRI